MIWRIIVLGILIFTHGFSMGMFYANRQFRENRERWLEEKTELLKRLDNRRLYRDKMLPGEPE